MEVLVRWAGIHWDQLQEPLGFDRNKPPCATTISRTLTQCQVGDFQAALSTWLRECLADSETEGVLAVDGKTAKQGLNDTRYYVCSLDPEQVTAADLLQYWSWKLQPRFFCRSPESLSD